MWTKRRNYAELGGSVPKRWCLPSLWWGHFASTEVVVLLPYWLLICPLSSQEGGSSSKQAQWCKCGTTPWAIACWVQPRGVPHQEKGKWPAKKHQQLIARSVCTQVILLDWAGWHLQSVIAVWKRKTKKKRTEKFSCATFQESLIKWNYNFSTRSILKNKSTTGKIVELQKEMNF